MTDETETWQQGDVIKIADDEYETSKVYVTLATDDEPGIYIFPTRRWFADLLIADHARARQVDAAIAALDTVTDALLWASGAFDTDEKSANWALFGLPALDIGLAALRELRPAAGDGA